MSIGVDYRLFKHLNPTKLKAFIKADEISLKRKSQEIEVSAYINGYYVARAIGCTFGKSKYPDKIVGLIGGDKKEEKLTDDDIKRQREQLIANLRIMKVNYDIEKVRKQDL